MEASSIRTGSLRLIAVEPARAAALPRDGRELAEVLGVAVPDGWPQFPEAFAPPVDGGSSRSERPPTDWRGYFFVHPRGRALVGNGGFTGDPDDSGVVEIGYEIAPEYRNRGYATEAARAMIGYAFAHADARGGGVGGHTLGEASAAGPAAATERALPRSVAASAPADGRGGAVVAHTLAETNASNAVLRKAGMSFV